MTGEEIARELINAVSVGYGITSDRLVAIMRDRASVNGVATRTIKIIFPDILDVGCYSHTIDLAGDKFKAPNLDSFIRLWISLFSHSPRARLWWKQKTGKPMASYSTTRWWSRWEVISQSWPSLVTYFPFLKRIPSCHQAPIRNWLLCWRIHLQKHSSRSSCLL